MILDMFAHIRGPKYTTELEKRFGKDPMSGKNPIQDSLEGRFESIDSHCPDGGYTSILSTMMENIPRLNDEISLAQCANDEYVELIEKYPQYFIGAAALLPTSDMKEALKEAERAICELKLSGLLLGTHVKGNLLGHEMMFDLYEFASHYDVPIWMHPFHRFPDVDFGPFDYAIETAKTMMDLSTSGVFERFPDIKFIAHHGGGVVPLMYPRMIAMYYCVDDAAFAERSFNEAGESNSIGPAVMGKTKRLHWDAEQGMKYFENLKKFYIDTALDGPCPDVLNFRINFFGIDKVLFGGDFPGGPTSSRVPYGFHIRRRVLIVSDGFKLCGFYSVFAVRLIGSGSSLSITDSLQSSSNHAVLDIRIYASYSKMYFYALANFRPSTGELFLQKLRIHMQYPLHFGRFLSVPAAPICTQHRMIYYSFFVIPFLLFLMLSRPAVRVWACRL